MANIFTYQEEQFHTGDTVRCHLSVTEGDKTRIQVFEGLIISIQNSQAGKSFVVRKIATGNVGVERIIPLMSPILTKIEKKSSGKVRQAKLFYLRDRVGKQASKVKTKVDEAVKVEKVAQPQIETNKPKKTTKKTA